MSLTDLSQCGEGVPERTKGYFGSHLGVVSKLLHVCRKASIYGQHLLILARDITSR
jgi:hypothetical protein